MRWARSSSLRPGTRHSLARVRGRVAPGKISPFSSTRIVPTLWSSSRMACRRMLLMVVYIATLLSLSRDEVHDALVRAGEQDGVQLLHHRVVALLRVPVDREARGVQGKIPLVKLEQHRALVFDDEHVEDLDQVLGDLDGVEVVPIAAPPHRPPGRLEERLPAALRPGQDLPAPGQLDLRTAGVSVALVDLDPG